MVVVERVEHLAKRLVQPGVRLVHAGALRVVRDRLATRAHLLVELLHGRVVCLRCALHFHVAHVVAHWTCNLPFLNLRLWFLGI